MCGYRTTADQRREPGLYEAQEVLDVSTATRKYLSTDFVIILAILGCSRKSWVQFGSKC
jgi:hypothetical protein